MFVDIRKVGYFVDKLQINFVSFIYIYISFSFLYVDFIPSNGLLINKI